MLTLYFSKMTERRDESHLNWDALSRQNACQWKTGVCSIAALIPASQDRKQYQGRSQGRFVKSILSNTPSWSLKWCVTTIRSGIGMAWIHFKPPRTILEKLLRSWAVRREKASPKTKDFNSEKCSLEANSALTTFVACVPHTFYSFSSPAPLWPLLFGLHHGGRSRRINIFLMTHDHNRLI